VSDWERIQKLVAERFGVETEEVREETDLSDDLGAESLDLYELVVALDIEFSLEPQEDAIGGIHKAGDLLRYINGTEKEE
jgi:acyl carrier protein